MAAKVGKDAMVALGTTQTLGMGTWTLAGVDTDIFEDTQFLDEYKTYKAGLKDSGTITFNGYYDPADSTGQDQLRTYWEDATELTSLRLYIDATSFWECDQTTVTSHVNITSWDVSADKSGLMACSFTAKVSGLMVLV